MRINFKTAGGFHLLIPRKQFDKEKLTEFIETSKNSKRSQFLNIYEWSNYKNKYIIQRYQKKSIENYHSSHIENIFQQIINFFSLKEKYLNNGIPFTRGILLHGPPGTGKTTTIVLSANKFNCPLFKIRIGDENLNGQSLTDALSGIIPPCIVVMEDLDLISENNVGILVDLLDSSVSNNGIIYFFTTNFYDKLIAEINPALLRPGRIDVEIYMGFLTLEQIIAYLKKFYQVFNISLSAVKKKYTYATLQNACLNYTLEDLLKII